MRRTKIKDLLKTKPEGQDIFVQGWVRSRRDSKEVSFVILNDGSIISTIQLVLGADYRDGFENEDAFKHILQQINTGACIGVRGKLVASEGKGQTMEIIPKEIDIYGAFDEDFPLQKKGIKFETLREMAHLRVRTNTFGAVFRVRHAVSYAIHKFFNDRGFFMRIHPSSQVRIPKARARCSL